MIGIYKSRSLRKGVANIGHNGFFNNPDVGMMLYENTAGGEFIHDDVLCALWHMKVANWRVSIFKS
jgi:hypothetical protein